MKTDLMRKAVSLTMLSAFAAGGLTAIDLVRPDASSSAEAASADPVSLVDPWVESDRGRYFYFQSASRPFGFIKLRPDSSTDGRASGYRHNEDQVKGFSHVRDWQLSGIQVMPTSGESVSKTEGDSGWQSHVDHDEGEIAQPGYHKLHLDRYGITAELTSTDRVGMHRYTYDEAGPSEIIVNLGGVLGGANMKDAHVTKVSDTELEGFVNENGYRTSNNHRLFFNIRFDTPFDSLHGWANGSLVDGGAPVDEVAGDNMGVYAHYDNLEAGATVQMKVSVSLTGLDGARANMEAELPGWDFDAVKQDAQDQWNEMLGRIDVSGGTHQQQVKFYTDLFHVLCGRSMISDADGKYLDDTWGAGKVRQIPLDENGKPEFAMYNSDAFWLTQWNLNSVLGMAYPKILSSFAQSAVQMYEDGGLLPRGPVGGDYTGVMTGSPMSFLITGAYNKGIRDFDADEAVDAMRDAQALGGLYDLASFEYGTWSNCAGAREYAELGYVPEEKCGGAGLTMEYSYQDWALGNMAKQLGTTGMNVAQFATAQVSSQKNDSDAAGARAIDGRPMRAYPGNVEWHSSGETEPWIQVNLDKPRNINKVVISDRTDASSNVNAGVLTFSNGTSIDVNGIADDGSKKTVEFDPRTVSWVKFQVTGGEGTDVGLNEIEVWDDTDLGEYMIDRSRNWRNLFDEETGFIRPREADGTWMQGFDPVASSDFVEANSWQSTWFDSYDAMGLANLMGGRKAYADKLNYAFEQSAAGGFIGEYGNTLVNYGNQPALQTAHLFNYVGYPWLTQYWVRQVKEAVYSSTSTTDGYGHHDEDEGQMGALSALMSMGLFEVTGGSLSDPVYDITSPIFDEITIKLDPEYYSGGEFRIVTHDNSAKNMYIQKATLDGQPWDKAWLRHSEFADGGTLELWMGDTPNKKWGTDELPPSVSKEVPPTLVTDVDIDAPKTVKTPYGSTQLAATVSPEDASYKRVDWTVTELDGSATDKATIDRSGVLTVNDQNGKVRVTATAADGGGAESSAVVRIELDSSLLRVNAARWPGVTATASSVYSSKYPAEKVFDGVIGPGDGGDWASKGEHDPWVQLDWTQPITADKIVLYDRPALLDNANGGTLTFSDGSSVKVTDIAHNGDPKTVTFDAKTFQWVRFQEEGTSDYNPGLAEFEVYVIPSVPDVPTGVSTEFTDTQATISWKPPAFDGGAPLTGYAVTVYRDGKEKRTESVDDTETTLTLDHLASRRQHSFSFTVAAVNLMGAGPATERTAPSPLLPKHPAG